MALDYVLNAMDAWEAAVNDGGREDLIAAGNRLLATVSLAYEHAPGALGVEQSRAEARAAGMSDRYRGRTPGVSDQFAGGGEST